jgi:hypothetical protein
MCEEDRAGRRKGRKEERGRLRKTWEGRFGKKEAMGRKRWQKR